MNVPERTVSHDYGDDYPGEFTVGHASTLEMTLAEKKRAGERKKQHPIGFVVRREEDES